MKRLSLITLALALSIVLAGGAWAVPGTALQNVFDDLATDGDNDVKAATDYISDANDSFWNITASGGSVATLIIELAGYAQGNIFGVYQGSTYVQIFAGSDSQGAQKTLSLMVDGTVKINGVDTGLDFAGPTFGYYLDSTAGADGGLWHSDSNKNNDGNYDHMYAYQGVNEEIQIPGYFPGVWSPNEYILAWEDLKASVTDADFTDFVVMVESVKPIPEPGTLILLGTALAGCAIVGRKRLFKKG